MAQGENQSIPKSKKRSWIRLQFSLRFMLVAFTVAAGFAWVLSERHKAAEEAKAVKLLIQLSEAIPYYASDVDQDGKLINDASDRRPTWFQKWLGPRFMDPVVSIYIHKRGLGSFTMYSAMEREEWELLSTFRGLRNLTISGDCSKFMVSDFENLQRLESLKIDSYGKGTPFPLAAINRLSSLKELELRSSWHQLYTPTEEPCEFRLKKLRLDGPLVDSAKVLSDFGDLSRLERLWVSNLHKEQGKSGPLSLKSKSGLPELKEITLINQKIEDASRIYDSESIEKIQLSGTEGVVSFFKNVDRKILPGLKRIHLELAKSEPSENDREIEYLNLLEHLPTLEEIALYDHRIRKIDALPELPNLRALTLGCRALESFDVPLNQIENLICHAGKIKHLNFLSSHDSRLRRCSIDCSAYPTNPSPVTNLDCLRFAKNLERLDIVESHIESVDFLAGLGNLKRIELQSNNQLVDIEAFSDSADSLESIMLVHNRRLLEYGILEQNMSQLKKLVIYDFQRKPYRKLDNLHLDLKGNLKRFDRLQVPNHIRIGEAVEMQELWDFDEHPLMAF